MVAKLLYTVISSLDGFVADEDGAFNWAAPDEAVHGFVNDLERGVGTYLYGRRMYEVMRFWDTSAAVTDQPPVVQDFASIWRAANKVVFSRTLQAVSTERTRLMSDFDPERVRSMKDHGESEISIGGATLAASAIRAGLVDEFRLFVTPVIVGGGTRALPTGVRQNLELVELRPFPSGVAYLRFRLA